MPNSFRSKRRPRAWAVIVIGAQMSVVACAADVSRQASREMLTDSLLSRLSASYSSNIGESIGETSEARFIDNGRYVLVLDRYSPHLKLFARNGRLLWTGGKEGGGPHELLRPVSVAAQGRDAVVVQRGRIIHARLAADSLVLRSQMLPTWFAPYGVEYDCAGSPLLYGMDRRQFRVTPGAVVSTHMTWLYSIESGSDDVALVTRWSEPRDPGVNGGTAHKGALISRNDRGFVILHRQNRLSGGRIVEFDCGLKPVRANDETALIRGNDIPAKLAYHDAKIYATVGLIGVGNGYVVATRKWDRPSRSWKTELFAFQDGIFQNSTLLSGRWFLFDFDPAAGALLGSEDPEPHFVVVPPTALLQKPIVMR